MDFGTPCKCQTSLKNKLAIQVASEVFLHAMKWGIFEYLLTITKKKKIHTMLGSRKTQYKVHR